MNATGFRVLVAEDEQTFGLTVTRFLQKTGHEVKICTNGKATLKALDSAEWDVLLLDLKLPDADGVDILARVRKEHPELQTIIVTGFANVQSAIDTMRLGAFDYLTKPPNFEELGMRVEKAGEKTLLERENRRLRFQVQRNMASDILTRSPVLQKVLRTIEMVAGARTPVLIEGESGVGKELLAQHAAPAVAALGQGLRRPQLRGGALVAARERAVRLRARGVHGRRQREAGARRSGGRGHAVPRRGRRDDPGDPVEVPARARLRHVLPRRRHAQAPRRLPAGVRHQPRPQERGGGGALPQGPVLPRQRRQGRDPAAARAARGHPAAGGTLHQAAARARSASRRRRSRRSASTTGRATCASCTSRSSGRACSPRAR